MAGDEQGEELVGDVGVVDLAAVVELRPQHHREDVDPLVEARVGEVVVDQLVDQPAVVRRASAASGAPGLRRPQSRRRIGTVTRRWPSVVIGGSSFSSSASSRPSAPKTARRMIRRVIVWKDSIEANSTPSGQLGHRPRRLLFDDRLVGAHPLAVEGRQQHPPLAAGGALRPSRRASRGRGLRRAGSCPRGGRRVSPCRPV